MLNNPTKHEVIETLIQLRDRIIYEDADSKLDLKERWYIPDCLAWAINYMEAHKDE